MNEIDNKRIKVSEYIKNKGIGNILDECDYNLRAVRNHLFRQCHLPKGTNLYHTMKKFKEYMANRIWEKYGENVCLVEEFLRKNFGGGNNVR